MHQLPPRGGSGCQPSGMAGGHVIPVSIHCGSYAAVNQVFAEDFTTEAGDAYYNEFEPDAFPSCMMDRTVSGGGVKINSNYDMWQSDLITCAAQTAPVEIELEATCDAAGQLSAKATVTATYAVGYDVSLQLWLVEDGIVGAQLSQGGIVYDYVHNHVLRGAINGTWGESVGAISAGNFRGAQLYLRHGQLRGRELQGGGFRV